MSPGGGFVKTPFRKTRGEEAEATTVRVTMTERLSYGEAKVHVTYRVQPNAGPAFDASWVGTVKMKYLPQAGQRLRVLYDPATLELLRVVTAPGQETAAPPGSERTAEIPWNDSGHAGWWANGTRRS